MNWLLLHPHEVDAASRFELRDRRAEHIREILGSEPEDDLRAGVLNEARFRVRLESLDDDCVRGVLCEQLPTPARPEADLLLALPRPKVLKRLLPQIAALGVRKLYLCKARKVEKSFFQSPVLENTCLQNQLLAGLEQVGDVWMPDVYVFPQFRSLIEEHLDATGAAAQRVVLHPHMTRLWSELPAGQTLLAVGPEGGWIPHELDLMQENGFRCAGLGDRVYRTDTAVVAGLTRLGIRA